MRFHLGLSGVTWILLSIMKYRHVILDHRYRRMLSFQSKKVISRDG